MEKEAHASNKKKDLSYVKDDTHLKNTILSKMTSVLTARVYQHRSVDLYLVVAQ